MVQVTVPILFETDVSSNPIDVQGETVDISTGVVIDQTFGASVSAATWNPFFPYAEGSDVSEVDVTVTAGIEDALAEALGAARTAGGLSISGAIRDQIASAVFNVLKGVEVADSSANFGSDYADASLAKIITDDLRADAAAPARQSLYEQLRAAERMMKSESGNLAFESGDTLVFLVKVTHSDLQLQYSSTLLRGGAAPAEFTVTSGDGSDVQVAGNASLAVEAEYYKLVLTFTA